jgi:hypothetical protein
MLLFLGPALAQTTDESAISKLLHTTFDRPQPLWSAISRQLKAGFRRNTLPCFRGSKA